MHLSLRNVTTTWSSLLALHLVLCFAVGQSIQAQGVQTATETPRFESVWAARIALFALRSKAGIPPTPSDVHYALGSARNTLGLADAVNALALMSKPLTCEAAREGAMLILNCASVLADSIKKEHTRIADRFTESWTVNIRQVCGTADPLILLGSPQEALIAPFSGVSAFLHEYQIDHSLAWQKVMPRVLPDGVCAFFLFGSGDKPSSITLTDMG